MAVQQTQYLILFM